MLTLVHSAPTTEADPTGARSPEARTHDTRTPDTGPRRTALVPGTLLDFLRGRTTGPAAQEGTTPARDPQDLHDPDLGDELMNRLHDMYLSALPGRLSAISTHTTAGNAPALASAAIALAGTSGQLGHPDVATVCQAIAADARRGVLAHDRVQHLQELAGA